MQTRLRSLVRPLPNGKGFARRHGSQSFAFLHPFRYAGVLLVVVVYVTSGSPLLWDGDIRNGVVYTTSLMGKHGKSGHGMHNLGLVRSAITTKKKPHQKKPKPGQRGNAAKGSALGWRSEDGRSDRMCRQSPVCNKV